MLLLNVKMSTNSLDSNYVNTYLQIKFHSHFGVVCNMELDYSRYIMI